MRLIEKIWFEQHQAKWVLVPLLLPLTALFLLISLFRRLAFRLGWLESLSVSKPVIVVGNIGVGGNGKTPMVIFLIEQCTKQGLTPGVISRGYGGSAPHYPYLLNENSTSKEAGDEPILIFQRCNVPVAVGSDRVASAQLLIDNGCDIIITDDGLQHYRLKRNIELIIVDGKRKFGNGLLLPAGPLREGLWRLKTADFVIVNGKQALSTSSATKANHVLQMNLVPECVCNMLTGQEIAIADFLEMNPSINAVAGIGDPMRFFNTLEKQHFSLAKVEGFVDHHAFTLDDFKSFSAEIPLLMTEKDAVKCKGFAQSHWWYLPVSADISLQETEQLMNKITRLANEAAQ